MWKENRNRNKPLERKRGTKGGKCGERGGIIEAQIDFYYPQSKPARRNIKNLGKDNKALCSEPMPSFVRFLLRELNYQGPSCPPASIGDHRPPVLFTLPSHYWCCFPPMPLKLEICFLCLNKHSSFQKSLLSGFTTVFDH